MAIKAIVFDISEVLIKENKYKSRVLFCEETNIPLNQFQQFVKKNLEKSFKGIWDSRKFFKIMVEELNLDKNPYELMKTWIDIRKKLSERNNTVIRLAEKLSKSYLVIGVANTTQLNEKIRKEMGFYDIYQLFEFIVFSNKIKTMKHEDKFYKMVLKRLKRKKLENREILVIDQDKKNLETARRLGMGTIQFKDSITLKTDLRKFGVA